MSMSNTAPNTPGFLPDTVWTRAEQLRPDDRVLVRFDDDDLWATVIVVSRGDDPHELRLKLRLERDGAPKGTITHAPLRTARYLRQLPADPIADRVPPTTAEGLEAALGLARRDHEDGTVSVHLPTRIAGQILKVRGWEHVMNPDGRHHSWRAPTGQTFWETDEALELALTADCLDAPPANEQGSPGGPLDAS
jgi:hypothetical protein